MDTASGGAFQLESSAVRLAALTDGLSNTILAGEKNVPLGGWGQGTLDSSQYNGDQLLSSTRGGGPGVGLAQSLRDPGWKFGSYHRVVTQFVFVDGSVHGLPAALSPDVLNLLVNGSDGKVIPDY